MVVNIIFRAWRAIFFLCCLVYFIPAFSFEKTTLQFGDVSLSGITTQGGFLFGEAPVGSRISFNGHPVRVNGKGRFIIGFGRDEKLELPFTIVYPNQRLTRHTVKISKRRYDIQEIEGIEEKYVTPPPETLARIKEDTRLVLEGRSYDTALNYFDAEWIWPARGRISGVFGSQRILNGKKRRPHFGVDIAAKEGTPVRSPNGGIVRVSHPDMYYSGGTILIDHGHGLFSAFLHMKDLTVVPGDEVHQGDIIGHVSSTGRSTGAHLDWRISWFNKRLDASLFVPPMGNNNG